MTGSANDPLPSFFEHDHRRGEEEEQLPFMKRERREVIRRAGLGRQRPIGSSLREFPPSRTGIAPNRRQRRCGEPGEWIYSRRVWGCENRAGAARVMAIHHGRRHDGAAVSKFLAKAIPLRDLGMPFDGPLPDGFVRRGHPDRRSRPRRAPTPRFTLHASLLIGIVVPFAAGVFGSVTVSSPFLKVAFTFSPSTGTGRRMLRANEP